MYPPCVEVNNYLLPETRKRVAKDLKKKGMREKDIAGLLHISQGMVSRYIREENSGNFSAEIDEFSREITRRIMEGYGEVENLEFFCNFCISLREKGLFCDLHRIDNCSLCTYMYKASRRDESGEISTKLKSAVMQLEKIDISHLVPEVRINIAYCRENRSSRMDVMAFPGRLTYVSGKLVGFSEPQFGASKHLSSILLNIREKGIRAIINLKFSENLISRLKKEGFRYHIMDREKFSSVEEYASTIEGYFDAIIDPGTFGIEPMVYILGRDPEDIVNKIKLLTGVI